MTAPTVPPLMVEATRRGSAQERYASSYTQLADSWFQLLLAGVLAVLFAQFAFLAHDAAHRQVFASGRANDWAGLVHGALLAGLSVGWWQTKHGRHHANPNKHGSDPDIVSSAIAFTPQARVRRHCLGAFLADRQGWFFFPLLLLEALNLHSDSVRRIVNRAPMRRRGWEIAFLMLRHGGYIAGLLLVMSPAKAVAFLGLYGLYLGGAFTPNHTGMPLMPPNLKLDFLRRQVLMSRNVTGGWLTHFALGGLNYQIEHHLFPSMARPNLRHVQPLVRESCVTHRVAYTEKSLFASYGVVVRYLDNVGLAARDPFGCPLATELRAPR